MANNRFHKAIHGAFAPSNRNRQVILAPLQQNSPWYYTAGPVFYPGADGAILNSKLSKAWQVIYGYAYRVQNPQKYSALQPNQLFAPKGVPVVGINIQLGNEGVLTPSVNDDGTYPDEGIFQYGPGSAANTTLEGEW